MGFLQRYVDEARRQSAVETESWAVRNFRRHLANISIFFGLYAAIFLGLGRFELSTLSPMVGCVIGGLLGVGVYVTEDARQSRVFGKLALALTVIGITSWLWISK